MDLCKDAAAREFGIGFINDDHGFVGTLSSGYETTNGGVTWNKVNIGRAANKIRVYDLKNSYSLLAIGVNVYHGIVPKP